MSLSDSTQTGPRCMSGAAVSLPDHQPARVAVWGGQSTQRRGEAPAEDTTHLPHPWLTYSVSSIFWNQLCPPEVLLPKKAISLLDAQPCGHTPHPHARPDVDTQDTCILSHVQPFATPWTAACQAPLSMELLQARALEWVAISSSRGSSPPRDRTCVSCIGRQILYH